jgi:hypothetical protein
MPMKAPTCGKCEGAMEEGLLLERGVFDLRQVVQWVKARAPKSGPLSTEMTVMGRSTLSCSTWRCTACGYLESYALRAAKPAKTTKSP